jgi:protein gp37
MMADTSKIEWTDATWNPITGCTMVSAGCTNCYAMGLAATRLRHHPSRAGLTREVGGRAVWTGEVRLNDQWMQQPLQWKRPRMIFVCAHGDLFHESVPDEWIDMVFAVMALAPQHTFQVLTKRPERMAQYFANAPYARWWKVMETLSQNRIASTVDRYGALPNVWLGTSVENQVTADERIGPLLATPAAVRFVSAEPLLGEVRLDRVRPTASPNRKTLNALGGARMHTGMRTKIDWVIVGGESGKNARPMHPDWARSLRDQCESAKVAFFFKQWGEWAPAMQIDGVTAISTAPDRPKGLMTPHLVRVHGGWLDRQGFDALPGHHGVLRVGKKAAGRQLDGREWSQMPQNHENTPVHNHSKPRKRS